MSPAEMITFPLTDTSAIQQEATVTIAHAQQLCVSSPETYREAGHVVVGLKTLAKRITEFFADDIERAYKLHRSLTKKRGNAVTPLEDECKRLAREMARWKAEEDRKAQVEAARLAQIESERQRQIALEQAAALEAQGATTQAAAVLEQAIAAPAPVVPVMPAAPKVEGVSYRDEWRHRVSDPTLVPREYWVIDEARIATVVRNTKGTIRIPGVEIYAESIAIVRSA